MVTDYFLADWAESSRVRSNLYLRDLQLVNFNFYNISGKPRLIAVRYHFIFVQTRTHVSFSSLFYTHVHTPEVVTEKKPQTQVSLLGLVEALDYLVMVSSVDTLAYL